MNAADEAYDAARRLIAEAKTNGARKLSFSRDDCAALDRFPPEIAGLTELTTLWQFKTQVSDLAPLAGLTAHMELALGITPVSDLFPWPA